MFTRTALLERLVMKGYTRQEIALALDLSLPTVYKYTAKFAEQMQKNKYLRRLESVQIVEKKEKPQKEVKPSIRQQQREERQKRALEFADLYKSGKTLQEIADGAGITRERIRQLLKIAGVTRFDRKKPEKRPRFNKTAHRHGISEEFLSELRANGATKAWTEQKRSAKTRGIEWGLDLKTWYQIWLDSGHFEERGRGLGKYVMSRKGDSGGYFPGNVEIKLGSENSREAVEQWRGKVKKNRGVFNLFKGRARSWAARVGKKTIGYYQSEAEAVAARNQFLGVAA